MRRIGIVQRTFEPIVPAASLKGDELQFRASRFELLQQVNQKGGYGCVVLSKDYQGHGVFSRHWYPISDKKYCYEERAEIKLAIGFEKSKFAVSDMVLVNPPIIQAIAGDKAETARRFADLQPKTMHIHKLADLQHLTDLDNGSHMVAIKGLVSHGGEEIVIDTIAKIQAGRRQLPPMPLVAQGFIETKTGAPGLVDGRHDVRVILLGGKVIAGSIRQPKAGGLLSNTKQGGSMRLLSAQDIPAELHDVAKQIDKRLPQVPRLFSADFMYGAATDRWYLIELNPRPGLLAQFQGEVGRAFQEALANYLVYEISTSEDHNLATNRSHGTNKA